MNNPYYIPLKENVLEVVILKTNWKQIPEWLKLKWAQMKKNMSHPCKNVYTKSKLYSIEHLHACTNVISAGACHHYAPQLRRQLANPINYMDIIVSQREDLYEKTKSKLCSYRINCNNIKLGSDWDWRILRNNVNHPYKQSQP